LVGTAAVFAADGVVVEDGVTERSFVAGGLAAGIVEGCVMCGFAPTAGDDSRGFAPE
jgi:hypothetical protein